MHIFRMKAGPVNVSCPNFTAVQQHFFFRWLLDWEKNHSKSRSQGKGGGGGGGGGRKGGGGGWGGSGQGDGGGFRAALLSGPPGVGKTTTAVLACEVSQPSTYMYCI